MSVTVLCPSLTEMLCILLFISQSNPLKIVLLFFPCYKQGTEEVKWITQDHIAPQEADHGVKTSLPHYNSPNPSTNCNSQRTTINITKKDSVTRSINGNVSFTDQ